MHLDIEKATNLDEAPRFESPSFRTLMRHAPFVTERWGAASPLQSTLLQASPIGSCGRGGDGCHGRYKLGPGYRADLPRRTQRASLGRAVGGHHRKAAANYQTTGGKRTTTP